MPSAVARSLRHLAASVREARLLGDAEIRELAYDSRAVAPGSLFCCIPGARVDGHAFAPAARAAGAAALLVERELDQPLPQLIVPSVRAAMGPIAAAFFDQPSQRIELIGVTGTNGKTTSTTLLASVAEARGGVPGLIGTVETRIGDLIEPVTHTTPEAIDVQRLLARMADAGVTTCAMEVSSHGLDMGRVDGCRFAAAVFTNLTQDHLDYHASMDDYFEAKALLFDPERAGVAVVNRDDAWGARLAERVRSTMPVVTWSLEHPDADVRAVAITLRADGSTATLEVAGRTIEVEVRLSGRFNVANATGVVAVAHALGWDLDDTVRGIAALPGVPGRVERIEAGQAFTVLVDYAHTPDSLDNVLRTAREITPDGNRLWVVFGCGGDRDRGKRPLMGAVGASLADRCIITSDNPRSEDPAAIVEEIAQGAASTGRDFEMIVDRTDAIAAALRAAEPGDVVVVAGKGHETGQQFADRTIPFDDRLVCREILESLR